MGTGYIGKCISNYKITVVSLYKTTLIKNHPLMRPLPPKVILLIRSLPPKVTPLIRPLPSKVIPLIRSLPPKVTPFIRPLPPKFTPLIRSLPPKTTILMISLSSPLIRPLHKRPPSYKATPTKTTPLIRL